MVNLNKRILYLDQLRSLAIISIVRVGVPLFLMVSGALLLNRKLKMSVFFKKRARSVVVPFICWAAIYSIFGLLYFSYLPSYEPTFQYFIDVFFGFKGVSSILWFMVFTWNLFVDTNFK